MDISGNDPQMVVRPDELLESLSMPNPITELIVEVHRRPAVRPEIVVRMPDEVLIAHDRRDVKVVNALSNTLEIPLELACRRLPAALKQFLAVLRGNGNCNREITQRALPATVVESSSNVT